MMLRFAATPLGQAKCRNNGRLLAVASGLATGRLTKLRLVQCPWVWVAIINVKFQIRHQPNLT